MNKIFSSLLILILSFIITYSCPEGCAQCDSSGLTCTACENSYQRTAEGACTIPSIQNCILFGPSSTCFKCKPSFRLNNNKCVKQYSGCTRYSTSNKCLQCGFGLMLNNENCVGILNCLLSSNSTSTCQQCQQGYKLSNNICVSSSSNCTQSDSRNGACLKCSQGNKLIGFKCIPEYIQPEYCYLYDINGQCRICKDGFSLLEGTCYTSQQIQKIYKGQTVRSRKIIKTFQSPSTNSSKNAQNLNETNNKQDNSQTNANLTNNDSAQKPKNPVDRCSNYDSSLSQCLACQNGYTLVERACYFAIQGCLSYQVVGKSVLCKQCSDKYQLQSSTQICLLAKQQAVKNCFIPSLSKLSCIVCNQGFVQNNGQCSSRNNIKQSVPEKTFCQNYDNQSQKCKICLSNFNFRLQKGLCLDNNCIKFNAITKNKCQGCRQNYLLNNSTQICELSDKNCLQVVNNKCTKCSSNYFVNNQGLCSIIPFGCQIPDQKSLLCSICKKDFVRLDNGSCRQNLQIQNCQTLETNINSVNKCKVCIDGFYPSFDACKKVSQRCNGYDKDTGYCIGCINGFSYKAGKCVDTNCIEQSLIQLDSCNKCRQNFKFINSRCTYFDVNCQIIQNNTCKQCINQFFYDPSKMACNRITNNIASNNISDLKLSDSKNGSQVKNSIVPVVNNTPSNNQTSSINVQKNNSGQILISNNTQIKNSNQNRNITNPPANNPLPLNNSSSGQLYQSNIQNCLIMNQLSRKYCLQCQLNYILSQDMTKCSLNRSIIQTPIVKDPNCQFYDVIDPKLCIKCSERYYLNLGTGKCNQVNQLCNSYDNKTGACLTCFEGFYLENGKCYVKVKIDQFCAQTNSNGYGCLKCIDGYFIDINQNNTCQKLDPLCYQWNYSNGKCISCKSGYTLVEGSCINLTEDPNCISYYSPDRRFCQKCRQNYFINLISQKCQQINDNCKTFNSATGECYTCKEGYKLNKGLCQKSINIEFYIPDYYCKTKDSHICIECYNGYYLSTENICKQKNPICKEINRQNGDCTQCYDGYFLAQGACIIPSNLQYNDLTLNKNCKNFTSNSASSCKQCYPGFRLAQGLCLQVNQLCKSIDQISGLCKTCYDGYYLSGGNCLLNLANNPNQLDPYCTQLSNDFMNCVKCAPGYFVGNQGYCQAFNTSYQCQNYSPQSGKCLSCYFGFVLTKQKTCIQQTKYCARYDQNTKCVECATGYFLKQGVCYPQDIKCQVYDIKSGNCSQCISNYVFFNNQCIFPTFGFDRFCSYYVNSYCTKCMEGSYLFNYRCRQIDPNCTKFDYINRRCLTCSNNLKVRGISCITQN